MRLFNSYSIFSILFLVATSLVSGQTIDIGVATREAEKVLPIAIESGDAFILKLARRAFELHGGYTLEVPLRSAYVFQIERQGETSVQLTIRSGQPSRELFSRRLQGESLEDAVLRAGDLAVEATLYSKGFFAGKLAFVREQRRVSEIYTANLLFSKVRPLTNDRAHVASPDWSPDGTRLLYTTFKSGFPDIYMITDLKSGYKIPIATFGGTNTSPAFSPDGERIAMSLSGRGSSEIVITDINGKNGRRITNNKSIETSPSWSPDGRKLVFESDMPGKPQLYVVTAVGGPLRRLPTNISGYCSEPAWNPVEKDLIAFTAAFSGGFQIALYDMNTLKTEVLTRVTGSAVEPEWLNDGRHLLFTQKRAGKSQLMLLDSKTKKVSPLHSPDLGNTSFATFVY